MCFGSHSHPPIPPVRGGALGASEVVLRAADGTSFAAWRARPTVASGAGVLVLPDQRGLHPYYEELAMRLAEHGLEALAIDWFGRSAGIGRRGGDFDEEPHLPSLTYAGLTADVNAGAAHLRSAEGGSVERLFLLGFCLGGRLALLAAAGDLHPAGVVGFYGRPTGPTIYGGPAPIEVIDQLDAPVLALFAGRDQYIPTANVALYQAAVDAAGAEAEVRLYPDAPHSFFDILADEYADASADAWEATLRFLTSGSGRSS